MILKQFLLSVAAVAACATLVSPTGAESFVFVNTPSFQRLLLHHDGIIQCYVPPEMDVDVRWVHKGVPVSPDSPHYVYVITGLLVRNVSNADTGEYTCIVENIAKGIHGQKTINVDVTVPYIVPMAVQASAQGLHCIGTNIIFLWITLIVVHHVLCHVGDTSAHV